MTLDLFAKHQDCSKVRLTLNAARHGTLPQGEHAVAPRIQIAACLTRLAAMGRA